MKEQDSHPRGSQRPETRENQMRLAIEYEQLTEAQKLLVRGMFHPTKSGYDAYLYELTSGGWVLSRRKRK